MRRTIKICLFYLTAAARARDASGSAWSGAGVTAPGQSGRPSVGNFHQIAYSFKGKRGPGLAPQVGCIAMVAHLVCLRLIRQQLLQLALGDVDLEFGRIVLLETEVPNTFANMV
jgi:hypothetical protein